MPRLSRQTKEILQTVIFLLIVGVLVAVYVVYPLIKTKTTMGRTGSADVNPDSLPPNDPTAFVEAGLNPDTFRVESDGLTSLACLYLPPRTDTAIHVKGTTFLLHDDGADRDAMLPLALIFLDSGYAVVAYDQRASGRSTGKYRGEGQYEANDLSEVIRYLDLRERIYHPSIVIGYSLGADAGLLASQDEARIDGVVAVEPYLTTQRMQDQLKDRYNLFWFPFFRTIMWWWYNIRSSYAAPYRQLNDLEPVACRTLLFVSPDHTEDSEIQKLQELSPPQLLRIKTIPSSHDQLVSEILDFAATTPPHQ